MSGDIIFWPWFALPDDQWCLASFHVPAGHLYVIFGKIFRSFANFYFCCTPWTVGSYFFDQILNPHPLHRKCGVFATESPGTSPFVHFFTELFVFFWYWIVWVLCIFWILKSTIITMLIPILLANVFTTSRLCFLLSIVSFTVKKTFSLI